MKKFSNIALAVSALFLGVPQSPATEGTGLTVEVAKRSVGKTATVTRTREDLKKAPILRLSEKRGKSTRRLSESTWSWSVSIRQTYLTVNATNSTIRAIPEGRLEWTVLVEKVYGGVTRYSGVEKLPPLRSLQSKELLLGPVPVGETRTTTGLERDKVEYEIVISHNDEETLRTASCAGFARLDSVAKRHPGGGDGGAAPKLEGQPVADGGRKPEDLAKLREPGEPPPGAGPGKGEKMPSVPPTEGESGGPSVEPPPVPQQAFDFFNLGGQKSAAAK